MRCDFSSPTELDNFHCSILCSDCHCHWTREREREKEWDLGVTFRVQINLIVRESVTKVLACLFPSLSRL